MSKLHVQPEIPLKSIFKNVFQTDHIPNYTILTINRHHNIAVDCK